jgi:Transposase DDE domain
MTAPRLDVTTDWDTIRGFLPEHYAELASELKQLNLQYGNAKIRTADDLLRLVLLHVGADLPLRQTVALMAESGGPDVSHVRLHKKLLRAVPYLRRLVGEMVDTTEAAPERWSGYDVVAVDATAVCGPGAETTDARLHTQLRIADLQVLDVRVAGIDVGETFKRFSWEVGQLAVADRGYCNAPGIGYVVERGADVLVRVNRGSLPIFFEDEPFELMPWLRLLPGHHAHEIPVVVHDKERDRKIAGRLVVMRLPEAQAEKARARLVRERGSSVSDLDREAASYVVLFTTVPKSRLDAERCLALYRLRWQVELLFKRWKSLCGLDRLPNYLDETIHSWLYAKVLLALLMQRMAASALSPPEPSNSPRRRRPAVDAPALEAHLTAVGRAHPRAPSPRAA